MNTTTLKWHGGRLHIFTSKGYIPSLDLVPIVPAINATAEVHCPYFANSTYIWTGYGSKGTVFQFNHQTWFN